MWPFVHCTEDEGGRQRLEEELSAEVEAMTSLTKATTSSYDDEGRSVAPLEQEEANIILSKAAALCEEREEQSSSCETVATTEEPLGDDEDDMLKTVDLSRKFSEKSLFFSTKKKTSEEDAFSNGGEKKGYGVFCSVGESPVTPRGCVVDWQFDDVLGSSFRENNQPSRSLRVVDVDEDERQSPKRVVENLGRKKLVTTPSRSRSSVALLGEENTLKKDTKNEGLKKNIVGGLDDSLPDTPALALPRLASPDRRLPSPAKRSRREASLRRKSESNVLLPSSQDYASATSKSDDFFQAESRLHAWLICHGLGDHWKAICALGAKKIADLALLTPEDMDDLGLDDSERKKLNIQIN